MTYKLNYDNTGKVSSIQNGNMSIPLAEGNTDFQAFLKWNEQQATPLDWHNPILISKTWEEIKSQRNTLLSSCDWTDLPNAVLSEEEKSAWQNYRQALRNVPQDFLTPDDVLFPTPPNEVI